MDTADSRDRRTRCYVIHPDIQGADRKRAPENALAEAVSLAHALPDLELVDGQVVTLRAVQPSALFGSGKLDELDALFKAQEVELVVIDGPVTPVQQRNLEQAWKVKCLDRTGLILEIFADRAQTREGVLQVELAALSYQRTRLVRAWTHLERQRGGLGFVGGPGETQIEADRRAIDEAVTRIKRQLAKVVKTRALHRAARAKVPLPIVALVGYTNAGKSTLFNRLTGADVFAQDLLFATLDPTMRGITLNTGQQIILSDTVGFISDLPTQLVAAFRATLEEVLAADLILHVRDIAHPETEQQAVDVATIMADLGVAETTPQFEVWNKVDLLQPDRRATIGAQATRRDDVLILSAQTGEGFDPLIQTVTQALDGVRTIEEIHLPFEDGRGRAWLYDQGVVDGEEPSEDGVTLTVNWTARQRQAFNTRDQPS
ncbi:GTPase HflX [Actibacterium sp. 188UL27-1]|uniref:GTPase HflX n=1 Tax=Actibacterium sp. 188UL27-1 TaxID=2786961 RepID=UPI0019562D03|nr:GTPase HflX [Actibacterium sp. 188UL27-1]